MSKLTVITFITLDNVVEEPHLWSFPYQGGDTDALNEQTLREADALLLGRVTYEGFAAAWPSRSGDVYSDKLNAMPKYVVSNTLRSADWNNSTIVSGDDQLEQVRALKAGQNVLVWGSPSLVEGLADAGLVDEYVLLMSPIVLGRGRRLFGGRSEQLKLQTARTVQGEKGTVGLVLTPDAA